MGKVPKPKKIKNSTLKNKADRLFSLKVRELKSCIRCGSKFNLQCAHIISRRYLATRYNLDNAVALCAKDHLYYTYRPLEWEAFIEEKFPNRLTKLKAQALLTTTIDYQEIIDNLLKGGE